MYCQGDTQHSGNDKCIIAAGIWFTKAGWTKGSYEGPTADLTFVILVVRITML